MKLMQKTGLKTVHRIAYTGKTWCNQPGLYYEWEYFEAKAKNGVPVVRAPLKLCRKCFPG